MRAVIDDIELRRPDPAELEFVGEIIDALNLLELPSGRVVAAPSSKAAPLWFDNIRNGRIRVYRRRACST